MTAAIRSLRQDDVDVRLRARIERLQKLIEAGSLGALDDPASERSAPIAICYPPDAGPIARLSRAPLDSPAAALPHDGKHRPLLPFPGYPNASISNAVEECLGLNMLGASDEARDNVLRELQAKIAQTKRYTYVCITDRADFAYFIQRGITFEYIGYLDRIADPHWKQYFRLNLILIKQKYGLRELILVGDPKYAA